MLKHNTAETNKPYPGVRHEDTMSVFAREIEKQIQHTTPLSLSVTQWR
jgi:hypothetical protein